jgi:hypothetical protein
VNPGSGEQVNPGTAKSTQQNQHSKKTQRNQHSKINTAKSTQQKTIQNGSGPLSCLFGVTWLLEWLV